MTTDLSLGQATKHWRRTLAASLLLAAAATGCEGAEGIEGEGEGIQEEGDAPSDTLSQQASAAAWCDVKPILDKSCKACHGDELAAGAPMSLTKPEHFKADAPLSAGKTVAQAVSARTHDSVRPMPPRGILPAADLAKLDAWIAAGSPAPADASCAGTPAAGGAEASNWPPKDCDEVYEFRANSGGNAPFRVTPGIESHPQIYFDAPWGNQKVQAIGFKPLTDNQKVLHHWILYSGMSFLTGWAPGDDEERPYPPQVGMDMPTGARSLRLDMHYYSTGNTQTEQDRSGVAVCVVKGNKLRPNSAAVTMGFTVFGPVLAPANKRGHQATSSCRVSGTRPVTLLTASPHAHKYARHMKFSVRKANGQEVVMHDQPFRFGEQGSYPLDPPVVLNAGDTVTTTCVFDNDTNRNITFGESTENEMCFNFAVYYPKGGLQCGGGLGGLGGLGGRGAAPAGGSTGGLGGIFGR